MSKFLKKQDLVNLANAVRRVTGYSEGMTVAQMTAFLNQAEIDGGSFLDTPSGEIGG